ncbi:MAG: signal peptide peptidase SppA [Burkholderiaceae bacterium]
MSLKSIFKPVGWLFAKAWWLLDSTRKVILNLLLLLVIVALVAGLISRGPKPLQDKTTLVLNLDGALVEQYSGSARETALAQLRGSSMPHQTRLRDVLQTLDAAARDDKIWALMLELDDFSGAGLASLGEVAAALQRFKASGKPILAYGDGYSQRGYYLAAQASEIYLHPLGSVQLTGFGGYRNYYKDALDRLGVSANVLRVGAYKNAAEPYFASEPSKASMESESYLYDDLWARYTGAIETARKLPKGALSQGIAALPERLQALKGDSARLALQSKLIDGIKTRDEMRALMMARGAKDDKGNSFRRITMAEYRAYLKPLLETGPQIGIVVAEGEIVDGEAGPGKVGGDSTAQLLRQAREDEDIKAIVLRVNSPGGSAFASEIVRRELELTRQAGKPVVVSMGDVAASGGYWISMASDQVIADAATVTGSIGVFGMLPTADKLLDKLSIHTGGYTTTWMGSSGYDPRRPLDPRMAAVVQAGINHIYDDFTAKAAQARKKKVEEIDAVAQGRVWSGAQALDRGLVDKLGRLDDAVQAAARLAKIEGKPHRVYVERELSRRDRLLASLTDVLAPSMAEALRAQLGIRPPAVLLDAGRELAWLGDLADPARANSGGHQPFAAVVHCLCQAP